MTDEMCDKISKEMLVAFADGELSPSETTQVTEHLTKCENCRAVVGALQQSIELVRISWTEEQAKWPKWRLPEKARLRRWPAVRLTAVAAAILFVIGLGLFWRMVSGPSKWTGTGETVIEAKQMVIRAGTAAQMLAVADMLASHPSSRQYARDRYLEIARDYCETEFARQAKLRLNSF